MRRTELDLCRIFGCLMVLMIHAGSDMYGNLPLEGLPFFLVCCLSTAARGGVPLFFMLSGALFLSRETLDARKLLTRHALRLTLLYYLWSLFYAALRAYTGGLASARDFFFAVVAGHYHLWFLPAMVMCYLFLPPVHAAVHRGGLSGKYLAGLFLFLGVFLANCNLTPDPAPILYRFTQNFSLDYLLYLGYAVWGWRLSVYRMPKRMLWLAPLVYVLVTLAAAFANRWYSLLRSTADGWLFHYFSLPSFLQASTAFCFFLALKEHIFKRPKAIAVLADATLGVYLIHPLLIKVFERFGFAPTPAAPVLSLLGFWAVLAAVCFALVLLLRRLPLVRRIL